MTNPSSDPAPVATRPERAFPSVPVSLTQLNASRAAPASPMSVAQLLTGEPERMGVHNEPIHIISLGAGVQSSTMALMAAKGEIMPMPKCAIFADTQDEPASVYVWLDWLEKQLPFPVIRVTQGKLSERSLK